MPIRRWSAVSAAGVLLVLAVPPPPAAAHGAPTSPVSRAAACGPEGADSQSPACVAALAASGGGALDWDNLRIANVDGRDRQVVPDGKLCSGGIDRFKGLDLPRADWPATRLRQGDAFTFRYRTTIQHKGTFKLFLTRAGYDPTRPLQWSALDAAPFVTAKEPPVQDGAYVFPGRLPRGRVGRHLIYTIWDAPPDTYYSCSDVVFEGPGETSGQSAGGPAQAPAGQPPAGQPASAQPAVPAPAGPQADGKAPATAPAANGVAVASTGSRTIRYALAIVLLVLILAGAVVVLARRPRPA